MRKFLRQVNPQGQVYVWSDMFDPFHNAHDKYYLVRGNLANSWEGLDRNIVIVDWNEGKAAESLKFFAERPPHNHRRLLRCAGRPSGRLAEGGPLGRQCRRRDVHHLGKQLRRSGSLCRARRVQAGQGELTAEPVELTAEPVELTAEPMYLTAEPMEDPGIDCIPFAFDCLNAPLAEAVFDPAQGLLPAGRS